MLPVPESKVKCTSWTWEKFSSINRVVVFFLFLFVQLVPSKRKCQPHPLRGGTTVPPPPLLFLFRFVFFVFVFLCFLLFFFIS